MVAIAVEKAGSTLTSRPSATGKVASSNASTSPPPNSKWTKPSRSACGSAQTKVSAVPRAAAASAAAATRVHEARAPASRTKPAK